jgi:hypothetical protein
MFNPEGVVQYRTYDFRGFGARWYSQSNSEGKGYSEMISGGTVV